jgi:hypothetical protein
MPCSRATNLTDSIFKTAQQRHCERSEAIHGAANAASEEWIASSQWLLAMTAGQDFAISPNAFFASYSFIPALSDEGAGNAGRPMRPRSRVQW